MFYLRYNPTRSLKDWHGLLSKLIASISGAESLSVAGNIFLGQTESPLMIKAYLEKMNRSEILLVMIGGMATVAGGVLAAYIAFLGGDDEVVATLLREAFINRLCDGSTWCDCHCENAYTLRQKTINT